MIFDLKNGVFDREPGRIILLGPTRLVFSVREGFRREDTH